MRLLVATRHVDIVGGVETYLHALLPRLSAAGIELSLLVEDVGTTPGILEHCAAIPVWQTRGKPVREIIGEISHWKPDMVWTQGLSNPTLESALAGTFPTILYAHTYHGTCVSGTKYHRHPREKVCERTLGLGCLTRYSIRGCGGRNPLTMLGLYRTQHGRFKTFDWYRAILVASEHMAKEYRRHGVPDSKLHVVPLFPPNSSPDPERPRPRAPSNRVLFVGRVTAVKGLSHLIHALPIASEWLHRPLKLIVAGDGPDLAQAKSEAERLGISSEFLGWISAERRTVEMRSADVIAVPSVWPEPFGLVGIEAGCVGLPAVGYATGGIPEWLIPGVSGEWAPGERPNTRELADALVRALGDEDHLQRLRIGAWETATRFTTESHLQLLTSILKFASSAALSNEVGNEVSC